MHNLPEEETITITGAGGIHETRTRAQLDKEAEALLKKRNKKKIPARYRVVPTSTGVDQGAIGKLIKRIKGND